MKTHPLLHTLVYAFNAITEEECFGTLTEVTADAFGEMFTVRGEQYTHVRRPTQKELENCLGTPESIFKAVSER